MQRNLADTEISTNNEPRHPIQVVARRTGLSVDVIRVWERRYGVVSPHRSSAKRRLYSDADILKLSLLHRATQAGRRISDLAGLEESEILALLSEDRAHQPGVLTADKTVQQEGNVPYLDACLSAIEQVDQLALERALSEASVALSIPELLEQVIAPAMKQIGRHWQQGKARVGHEHFATATIRSFLGHLVATANMSGAGPTLLVATPVGQNHELGALMAALIAAGDGWRVAYLGPNIPARDLAAIVKQQQPRAVALGISYPPDDARILKELQMLRQQIPDEVHIIVGGEAVKGYRTVLKEIGAQIARDLNGFRDLLKKLRASPV
jgi:DNA-binding transcriptional MerR regulator/methylmalonyl-CoA mutase cobalamin-binding subunit